MDHRSLFDLHAHTTASDGKLRPAELVRLAKSEGLRALAITDHDTVEGLAEAQEVATELGIELVPGVEVSANFGDVAIHVLGLFIRYEEPWLARFFSDARRRRIDRVHEIVRKLANAGVEIDAEAVLARSSHGTVGRPHVAEELVEQGRVSTITEAFDRYLAQDRPAYVGYQKVSLEDALDIIGRAGGVASLAHPVLMGDDALIPEMARRGLPAIEVFHKDHPPEKEDAYEKLAAELDLLVTGGSDFHRIDGEDKPRLGCTQLTEEAFDKLRAFAG